MIRFRRARGVVPALFLVAVLAGCGSAPAPADPAGTVRAAFDAAQAGGLGKLTDYACAARKGDFVGAFGGGDLDALEAAGLKAEDVFAAMSVKFENVVTKEVSRTDTTATVHITADMRMSMDRQKFRELIRTVLTAQGQPADDATLDKAVDLAEERLTQPQKLDNDVLVVKEGGKWLICGAPGT